MSVQDLIIIAVLILVLAISIGYIIKAKKSGVKCIGCPASHDCKSCGCGCQEHNQNEN